MRSLYRILRQLHAAYPYVALSLFIAAFLLAFIFMFIFPLVSLGLVFLGLLGLGVMVVMRHMIEAASTMMVRRLIHAGSCPECGSSGAMVERDCPTCGAGFTVAGKPRDEAASESPSMATPEAD